MKIAIIGRQKDTINYEHYFSRLPAKTFTTLSLGSLSSCHAVILPGGGDITPAFFGERNNGSRSIDTELDILQFKALDFCISRSLPIIGICKGMQVINVAFGGTLYQDLPTSKIHQYQKPETKKHNRHNKAFSGSACGDQYHDTIIAPGTYLADLYGEQLIVNSAHHQGLHTIGRELTPIQWCKEDQCVEAIIHNKLPIYGLQWHPERIDNSRTGACGDLLLNFFSSLISCF